LAGNESDKEHEIERHVPQVLAYPFGIVAFEIGQIVNQTSRLLNRIVLSAGLGRDSLEELDVLRRIVELPVEIRHKERGPGGANRSPSRASSQLDAIQTQGIGFELAAEIGRLLFKIELQRHIDGLARGFRYPRGRLRISYGLEL